MAADHLKQPRSWVARVVAGAVIWLLVAFGLPPGGPSVGAAPVKSSSVWATVPAETVSGENFVINAAAVPSQGDVWVAGYHWEDVGGTTEFRALAEHFNGRSFVVVPTSDRETTPPADFVEGLSGTSASDLWAVGVSQPPGTPNETLIEHWDGTSWSIVASPNPGSAGNILQAVVAIGPADVWAVGALQDTATFYQMPMALHWDGTAWTAMKLPNPSGCTGHSYLTAVSGVSARDVWAAGWCGSGGSTPQQGYVEHWNGSGWVIAAARGTIPVNSQLYGLSAVARSDVWVVGLTQQPGSSTTVALTVHWDGSKWRTVAVNTSGNNTDLHAVLAEGGVGLWSVGTGSSSQPPFAGPLSVHLEQGVLLQAKVPVSFGSLAALAADGTAALWAAGSHLDSHGLDVPLVLMRPLSRFGIALARAHPRTGQPRRLMAITPRRRHPPTR